MLGFALPAGGELALDVLRHRIIISYEAEAEEKTSEDIIKAVLEHVPVP